VKHCFLEGLAHRDVGGCLELRALLLEHVHALLKGAFVEARCRWVNAACAQLGAELAEKLCARSFEELLAGYVLA